MAAALTIDWSSESLHGKTTVQAVIPSDHQALAKPLPTLYLLHGITGNHTDWITRTRIAALAEQFRVAVVMPAGDNSFFVDQAPSNRLYGQYIGQELVAQTRRLFPLSHRREETWIGGLLMGGYGAIRNGLKYHQTFGAIVALSSALVMEAAIAATDDATWPFARRQYFASVFGDLDHLGGSDNDVEVLAQGLKNRSEAWPRMYLACGTDDELIAANRHYHDFLSGLAIDHTYVEGPGSHDWAFWDAYIERALKWLKPIEA